MGANKIFLISKFYMKENNVYEMWKQTVNCESDEVRMSVQIRELCVWKNICYIYKLNLYMSLPVFKVSSFMANNEFQTN